MKANGKLYAPASISPEKEPQKLNV